MLLTSTIEEDSTEGFSCCLGCAQTGHVALSEKARSRQTTRGWSIRQGTRISEFLRTRDFSNQIFNEKGSNTRISHDKGSNIRVFNNMCSNIPVFDKSKNKFYFRHSSCQKKTLTFYLRVYMPGTPSFDLPNPNLREV